MQSFLVMSKIYIAPLNMYSLSKPLLRICSIDIILCTWEDEKTAPALKELCLKYVTLVIKYVIKKGSDFSGGTYPLLLNVGSHPGLKEVSERRVKDRWDGGLKGRLSQRGA